MTEASISKKVFNRNSYQSNASQSSYFNGLYDIEAIMEALRVIIKL